jgi:hypothetical protein
VGPDHQQLEREREEVERADGGLHRKLGRLLVCGPTGGRKKRKKGDGPQKKKKKEGEKKVGLLGLMGWRPGVVGLEKKRGSVLGGKREKKRERGLRGFSKLLNICFKNHTTSSKTDAKA